MRQKAVNCVARIGHHPRLVTTLMLVALLMLATGGAAALDGDLTTVGTHEAGTGNGGPTKKP